MTRLATLLAALSMAAAVSPAGAQDFVLKHRVVFFPGLMGSELRVNSASDPENAEVVWGTALGASRNFEKLRFPIKLEAGGEYSDPALRATKVLDGFYATSIWGWRSIQVDPAYGPFLDHLDEKFAVHYHDYHTSFPYDWRQSNVVSACKFKQWLDRSENAVWAANARSEGLVLLGHSMGGIVARLFTEFRAAAGTAPTVANPCPHQYKVFRLISVQTPYFGSQKALKSFVESLDSAMSNFQGSDESGREVFFTVPSVYELLPSYKDCCFAKDAAVAAGGRTPLDVFDPNVWISRGWIPANLNTPTFKEWLKARLLRTRQVKEILSRAPRDVETLFITSLGYPTITTAVFASNGREVEWISDPSGGDDTVPGVSASIVGQNKFVFRALGNHMGLLDNPRVKDILRVAMQDPNPLFGAVASSDTPIAVKLSNGQTGQAIGIVLHGEPVLI